jgi:hypothetical protein
MSEELDRIIAKIKAKENSQQVRPVEKKETSVAEKEDDYSEEDLEEDREISEKEEKPSVKPSNEPRRASESTTSAQQMSKEERIMMEIEMLQNNGRYRAELLHQLQEINKALIVIAGALANNGR